MAFFVSSVVARRVAGFGAVGFIGSAVHDAHFGAVHASKFATLKKPICRPVVICGPSGAGKSTIVNAMMKDYPLDFGFSVSHTTRGPRPGEVDGVSYHFVERSLLEQERDAGLFIETAEVRLAALVPSRCPLLTLLIQVHGNMYGTSTKAVMDVALDNKICVLDLDVQVCLTPCASSCT
jgi:guanylate kinase